MKGASLAQAQDSGRVTAGNKDLFAADVIQNIILSVFIQLAHHIV